jgi:hypothetical protein
MNPQSTAQATAVQNVSRERFIVGVDIPGDTFTIR